VLSGALTVEAADGGGTATAGDVIGMYETLAGVKLDATVTAVKPAHVLRLDRDALFEVLADYTDLLQGVFSKLMRQGRAYVAPDL
jgi:CRP-like cAMP-binding protein